MVFEDESLLMGLREQAINSDKTMAEYVQDLIRQDLRRKVGYKLTVTYEDGTTTTEDLWTIVSVKSMQSILGKVIDDPSLYDDFKDIFKKRPIAYDLYKHKDLLYQYPKKTESDLS